jgi:CBS domain-containing protein
MSSISNILEGKGRSVFTIQPRSTIAEAIRTLVKHRIGSLLVTSDEGSVCGIITERDVLNFVNDRASATEEERVEDHMTREVITGNPEDTLDAVMALMTEKRFRHLPVLEDGQAVGMISIGDVVKAINLECQHENSQLKTYLAGGYA